MTATALFGFPYALATTFGRGGPWFVLLAADLLVLGVVAVFLWSPVVVLTAAVVSGIFFALAAIAASAAGTCGTSTASDAVELAGGAVLGITITTLGVRRGPRVLWALPAGWIAYTAWIIVVAHLVPGGAGGCFT